MNGYKLKIKNSSEEIALSTADGEHQGSAPITSAAFKMNTINDNTLTHASDIRAELKIFGAITDENREETLKLAEWAMDANRNTLYRDVELIVYSEKNCTGKKLRTYKFSTMFVIDYQEEFAEDSESGIGTFELFIAQKDGPEKKEIYAD